MRFAIELSGIPIGISTMYAETAEEYRAFFADSPARFSVEVTPREIEEQRGILFELEREQTGRPLLHREEELENQAIYQQIAERLPDFDAVLFHGSALAMDGEGYLFAGPSGMGKSTHARVWRRCFGERVTMINDDKPILRCTEGGVTVGSSPWRGKHRLGENLTVPLRGICILRQSPENRIAPLQPAEAYALVLRQCYLSRQAGRAVNVMRLVERITNDVPIYRLECNMELEAARVAYAGMRAGRGEEDE